MNRFQGAVERYTDHLTRIFRQARDKHQAHRHSVAVLQDMTGDPSVIADILAKHLRTPGTLNRQHYPVVSANVALNPYYSLEANCWIPLPDGDANVSTKAIHHHGNMLLSTATAFGPGYEHWTFTRPEAIDPPRERYSMRLIERAQHPLHHVAFVDSYIAHLPMYPPALTITLALWSNQFPTTWKDRLKRLSFFKRHESLFKRAARALGLARTLDLKIVEYFDFFPTEDGFQGMRERIEFQRGPNEDYLYSLFCILQKTGNEQLADTVQQQLGSGRPLQNPELVAQLIQDLRSGRPIEGRLSQGHYGIPFANFTAEQIERALGHDAEGAPALPAHSASPVTRLP